MQKWISIKEQLPEDCVGVLITDGEVITAARLEYWKGEPWWWCGQGFGGYEWEFDFSNYFTDGDVTHWMHLPKFPEKTE